MAINTLEYAKLFQTELDKQVTQQATSGWMEENAGQVKYNGGNEIKIPEISTSGMGDYDRDNGFVQGSVTFGYQTHTLTQDRGRTFQLDANDVDETNFGIAAANVMSEFQRLKVIPEIDAYRYSKIATKLAAAGQSSTYTPDPTDVLNKLYADLIALGNTGVDWTNLVISMSWNTFGVLGQNESVLKQLQVDEFSQGGIVISVRKFEGVPIIPIAGDRMKTAYVFNDGTTAGQEAGGFTPTAEAKDINWIITPRRAPIGISKTDTIRIFDPMQNQKAHAWKIDYRKYHDLIIPENQLGTMRVSVGA
ncbi:hypothetical protein ACFSL6_08915 [Paenibacillus thailandensis]|uniref:Phage capsid protein n=1 Tax=Paenibacillus thailandensis TaxID=393250 RepID=A0ABW5QSW2_9BACL